MEFRRLKLFASISLSASLILNFSEAQAFLAGSKATGMAATGIAYPQDAYAGAYNPAGIIDVGDRVDGGIAWIQDRGHAVVHDNLFPLADLNDQYDAFKTKDVYDADFGANKVFYSVGCDCNGNDVNLAVGIVGYNRDYQKTTYNRPFLLLGNTNLGLEYLHETFSPLAAINWNCHSFGMSIDVHVQRAKANGLENFALTAPPIAVRSIYPDKVTNRGYAYSSGVGVTFGWKFQVNECLSVGVTYRTKTKMSRFSKYKGFLAGRGRLNVPQKVGAGIAYTLCSRFTATFDFEWLDWHGVRALHNSLLHEENLELLGTKHGPGFGFQNQFFYRFGLAFEINDCWTIRAGFRHANAPVRRSQTAVNLLTCDVVEDVATVGLTYVWDCNFEISAFYAHGFSHHVKGKNSIPAFFGGGEIDLTEAKNALGVSVGYLF